MANNGISLQQDGEPTAVDVRGTVSAGQANVSVNGVPASISNRSYLADAVPLTEGDNLFSRIPLGQRPLYRFQFPVSFRRRMLVKGTNASRFLSMCVGLFCCAVAVPPANAEPQPSTSQPKLAKVTQEHIYYYMIADYAPPYVVTRVNRHGQKLDSPEHTAIALISAMMTADYDWYISLWDDKSVALMKEKDAEKGRSRDTWIALWEQVYRNTSVTLTKRIETGEYVIVAFEVKTPGKPENSSRQSELIFRKQGDSWLATQALAGDPVLYSWRTPERKLPVVERDPKWTLQVK